MKAARSRSRLARPKTIRSENLPHHAGFVAHSLENLLLLSAARRASSAELRFAALVRLEEIRELKDYLHTVNVALLQLLNARRIGAAERRALTRALMLIPMPRRSRVGVRRKQRMNAVLGPLRR